MKTKYVYAIYPKDENGNIAGVYVGSSENVERRIKHHLNRMKKDPQPELHELMRTNGFTYEILEAMEDFRENYKEYKWIEAMSLKYSKVFNKYLGNCHQLKQDGIGPKINQYLSEKRIPAFTIAKFTGINNSRLWRILHGYIDLDVIEYYKICKALQLPLNYFLEGIEK